MDYLGFIMLSSPTFEDPSGFFPDRNVETTFWALNESLKRNRRKLGDECFEELIKLSERMRAHFEADPHDENGETYKGRMLIHEMEDLLTRPANDPS